MRLTKIEQQLFDESYATAGKKDTHVYPTFADCVYISDMNFRLVRSRNRGARRWYKRRTERGRAMVHRNWVRRYPKLFTKATRDAVLVLRRTR
jgi:hypothetical protein